MDTGVQVGPRGDDEQVQDLALRGTDSGGRHQDHAPELSGICRGHLGGNPAAEGKADHIHRPEAHLPQHAGVEAAKVPDTAHPFGPGM